MRILSLSGNCSRKGGPPNDITRADEAPMAECAAGTARWRSLLSETESPVGRARQSISRSPRSDR
jgi:hypothetical protein